MFSGKFLFVSASILGLATGFASAATVPYIGVNFLGGASDGGNLNGPGNGAPSSLDTTPPGMTAGLVPQNNWNDISGSSGTGVALHDSSGAASGVTLSFAGSGVWSTGASAPGSDPNATGDTRLMNGYVDGFNSDTNTYTFNNVPAGTYELIAYALPDSLDGRTSHYTLQVNGNPGTTYYLASDSGASFTNNGFVRASSTTSGTYVSGNYLEWDTITLTSSGSIGYTGTSDTFRNYSNGIQLVAVPEPASLSLLGLGGLSLLARRRRA